AAIASTDMELLLRDDVFVDFFNTFLNLPVFGQTPIYNHSTGQWDLWPELPHHMDLSPPALLAWLKKHRLPHFCKSSLCLHLILCQKLLGFIRSQEAAKLLNWQSADQWLLEKCISRSQGMQHFRVFIRGMAGEELINFWFITERLLGIDESDAEQRDLYLSLLHRLKATHLREGSTVVTLCRITNWPLLKARHVQSIRTRREILRKMQERALFMIQSYWLPKFFLHCMKNMKKEKSCQPLLREYQKRLLQGNLQEPSDFSKTLLTMYIKKSQGFSGSYCSKKAKAEIWTLVKGGGDTEEMKMPSFQVQPEKQPRPSGSTKDSCLGEESWRAIPQQPAYPANTVFGGISAATSPRRPRPFVRLPHLKKPVSSLSFLPWALSAESCAGRPFRDFLKHQDRSMETRLLDLWHDLEEFQPVVLDSEKENSFFLRHLMGEGICKTYLEERTIQQLPLETRTLRSLRDDLVSAEFSPWIFRTQNEICKVLFCIYEEYLADDDKTFLQFMSPQSNVPMPERKGHVGGKEELFLLSQRINQSLKLSQALHGTTNLEDLSLKQWLLVVSQDIQSGSIVQEDQPALADKQPALADKQPALADKQLAEKSSGKKKKVLPHKSSSFAAEPKSRKKKAAPMEKNKLSKEKSTTVIVEKPNRRPRHFVKVLHHPVHLQYFKQFLKERKADQPLRFWMAVEKLVTETDPEKKSSLIEKIVSTFFHAKIPAGDQLACHNAIIKEISKAEVVTHCMLMTAQVFVQKAMEKRWFQEYQDLFPPSEIIKSNLPLQHEMRKFVSDKVRRAWYGMRSIIRSICKFHREIRNPEFRMDFESFLHQELQNKKESMA
ncbi:RGSL protein, partial [Centropus unirufus]|nr:RGSL protein [Centropus unirufus]